MQYSHPCNYIYRMKPQACDELKAAGNLLCALNNGRPVSNGIVKASSGIYACLVYDHCRVITFVTDGIESEVINLIFRDDLEYRQTIEFLKKSYGMKIHIHDGKVISYARNISEKLRIGVEVAIIPPQKEDDCIVCPVCGVMNHKDSGLPFCLECGAPLE